MIRNHLLFLRCPECKSPLKLHSVKTEQGKIRSGFLLCRSCEYRGLISAWIPILLPQGVNAEYTFPFERIAGDRWKEWAEKNGWDSLYSKLLNQPHKDLNLNVPMLTTAQLKRGVYCGSDYYYKQFIEMEEDDEPSPLPKLSIIINQVVEAAPRRMLEIAANTGRLFEHLTAWRPNTGIAVAVDLDFVNLKILEGRLRRSNVYTPVLPIASDIHSLPFPNDFFDCIVSYNGLSHIEDIDTALWEIRRILRPGGFISAVEPAGGSLLRSPGKVGELLLHVARKHLDMHHGVKDIADRLRKLKFHRVKSKVLPAWNRQAGYVHAVL